MTEVQETKYLQITITGTGHRSNVLHLAWLMNLNDDEREKEQKWIFEGVLRAFKAFRRDEVSYTIKTASPRELIGGAILVKDAQQIIDNIAEWMEHN